MLRGNWTIRDGGSDGWVTICQWRVNSGFETRCRCHRHDWCWGRWCLHNILACGGRLKHVSEFAITSHKISKNLLETSLFRSRSSELRCFKNTSASSSRTTVFHFVHTSRTLTAKTPHRMIERQGRSHLSYKAVCAWIASLSNIRHTNIWTLKIHTGLSRQSFAYPRRTAQQYDHDLACLTSVSIPREWPCSAPPRSPLPWIASSCPSLFCTWLSVRARISSFMAFGQNQTIKHTIVPLNVLEGANHKRHYWSSASFLRMGQAKANISHFLFFKE